MTTTPQIAKMENALLENAVLVDQEPDSRVGGNRPVIFLDVDGVICLNDRGELELAKLEQLARVCMATGAGVVLSSDWRRRVDLKKRAYEALDRMGKAYRPAEAIPATQVLLKAPKRIRQLVSTLFSGPGAG